MRRLLVVGTVATVAGLVGAFAPSLVPTIGPTYGAVVVFGLLAALIGAVYARRGIGSQRRYVVPREREPRQSPPTPGDEFDEQLASLPPASTRQGKSQRAALRERLETAAVNVLVHDGHDPATAHELLETGEWTDDPHAASFFAAEPDERSGVWDLRRLLTARGSFERRAKRAADAIAARSEGHHE